MRTGVAVQADSLEHLGAGEGLTGHRSQDGVAARAETRQAFFVFFVLLVLFFMLFLALLSVFLVLFLVLRRVVVLDVESDDKALSAFFHGERRQSGILPDVRTTDSRCALTYAIMSDAGWRPAGRSSPWRRMTSEVGGS